MSYVSIVNDQISSISLRYNHYSACVWIGHFAAFGNFKVESMALCTFQPTNEEKRKLFYWMVRFICVLKLGPTWALFMTHKTNENTLLYAMFCSNCMSMAILVTMRWATDLSPIIFLFVMRRCLQCTSMLRPLPLQWIAPTHQIRNHQNKGNTMVFPLSRTNTWVPLCSSFTHARLLFAWNVVAAIVGERCCIYL